VGLYVVCACVGGTWVGGWCVYVCVVRMLVGVVYVGGWYVLVYVMCTCVGRVYVCRWRDCVCLCDTMYQNHSNMNESCPT